MKQTHWEIILIFIFKTELYWITATEINNAYISSEHIFNAKIIIE